MLGDKKVKKVGANESCHCGSGQKYKRCCAIANKFDERHLWYNNANKITTDENLDCRIAIIYFALLDFIIGRDWRGACHPVAAIFYMILCEQGFNPKLCAGIVRVKSGHFVHSWIELNGSIYDVACAFPCEDTTKIEPIFGGKKLDTLESPKAIYGFLSSLCTENESLQAVLSSTIFDVMAKSYEKLNGECLWSVMIYICSQTKIDFKPISGSDFLKKYSGIRWELRDVIPIP